MDEEGNVLGEIAATGVRPSFAEKVALSGIQLDGEIFEPRRVA
jgi:hypothetical protein